jgi:acetyl esterase
LAAAVTLKARDAGGPALAYQLLIYPVTDHDLDTPSYLANAEGYLLEREGMRWFWNHYLADARDAENPLACPLRAANLAGLPPAFVVTAEFDPLCDDGDRYVAALRAAGVPVTHRRYDGMIHGFFWMTGVLDQSRALYEEIGKEVRRGL